MTTYLLVPGFWLGGWAWWPVTAALRKAGHDVHPVTLTGVGDRTHLGSPETDLNTHVADVVNVLRYEDLHDVVLVGHSYGGVVVTGAADRMPERVSRLVYVDGGPLPDGSSQADFATVVQGSAPEPEDGWLPPPPWADLAAHVPDVDRATLSALAERSVRQPWASAVCPARLDGAWEKLPRVGVLSSFTVAQLREMAASVPLFRHMAAERWRYVELPTWHWPMFSRPAELAEILLDV
jgi:pimeloyl-ACP methyl ester carboxylesterase